MHSLRLLDQILVFVCLSSILFVVVFGDDVDSDVQKKLASDKNAIVIIQKYANRDLYKEYF